jgi:prolyl oligopeptidase
MALSARVIARALLVAIAVAATGPATALAVVPPETRHESTQEVFFGTTVDDPYRWLEETAAPVTRAWFQKQNGYARTLLDGLPGRAALRARIEALNTADPRSKDLQVANEHFFYLKRAPGEPTYRLYVRDGLGSSERLLIDPASFDRDGQTAEIDYYRVSPNGRRVAFGIALGGSEDASLRVIDVASRKVQGAPIPRTRWAAPAWRFDSAALFYTQQKATAPAAPAADLLRGSSAFVREFGADGSTQDSAVFGPQLNPGVTIDPDDTPSVESSPVSPFVIGVVTHGVQREQSLYVARLNELRGTATPWRKLAGRERGIVGFDLRGEWIYLVTNEDAPRYRVVRWSLASAKPYTAAAAEVVVAESERVIRGISVAKDALYVQQEDAGHGKLLRLQFNVKVAAKPRTTKGRAVARRHASKPASALPKTAGIARSQEVALPVSGAIQERVTDPLRSGALLRVAGWTQSPAYVAVDGALGTVARTALLPPSRADFANITSSQVRVRSHDGVEVPLSIIHARNAPRDGSARLMLDAYGAYGISQEPFYSPSLLAWLERGGIFAVAHVRGGGELGKEWHRGGFRSTKANSWRDMIAAAEWLVREKWTVPSRLAISGSSAGALAAGNAMIERPDLFAALVSEVGFHDTLRSEIGMVGPANVPEFGSIATEAGFRDLLAMSSYARLRDGTRYPAALFTTGFNDPRVDAWDPGKMAARMQAINGGVDGSGKPVLLRVDFAGGHGGGTTAQMIDEYTDVFAFLLWQTGAAGFQPP